MEQARANGAVVIHEPEKVNQTIFAFVQDHDGYKFKFIQTPLPLDPLSPIMLRVQNLDLSANFYSKVHTTFYNINLLGITELHSNMILSTLSISYRDFNLGFTPNNPLPLNKVQYKASSDNPLPLEQSTI